jgi:hypothetical protein
VPVPSDYVISPLARPFYIISSIIYDTSPLGFIFFIPELNGSFFPVLVGESLFSRFNPFCDLCLRGFRPDDDCLGPDSFFFLIYLIASSLE